jgi:hypothetical protein
VKLKIKAVKLLLVARGQRMLNIKIRISKADKTSDKSFTGLQPKGAVKGWQTAFM